MADIIKALVEADGAILYWQLPRPDVEAAIARDEAYMDGDLLVHRVAVANGDGSYSMPDASTCRHRNDGRGRCIDCGAFI